MSGSFQDAARASLLVKKFLDELRLASFPKTSGSRGVHIFIPIKLGPTADEVLAFAEKLVALAAKSHPKELTVEHRIADRGDRVYLDPFRNGAVQTVVTPYSVRRKPACPSLDSAGLGGSSAALRTRRNSISKHFQIV